MSPRGQPATGESLRGRTKAEIGKDGVKLTVKTAKGEEKHTLGRFLTVWHRQADKWVISRNLAF